MHRLQYSAQLCITESRKTHARLHYSQRLLITCI